MRPDGSGKSADDARRTRLAASLRENLKRRKSQQRSRDAAPADAEPEDSAVAGRAKAGSGEDDRREI
jgi:hypothetical protein